VGSRNSYSESTIKAAAGPATVERLMRRGTSQVFASRLFGTSVTKSNAVESVVSPQPAGARFTQFR
jgi:putative transposase